MNQRRLSPDHATPNLRYPGIDPVLAWTSRIALGAAVTILIGPSSNSATINTAGASSLSKEVITQIPITDPTPLPTLEIPASPLTSPSVTVPKPIEVTAANIPFGNPYSYVLDAKALGGLQKRVFLKHMSCPQECDRQVVDKTHVLLNPDPPDYKHVFSYTWPQMGITQGNINLAHASEIPGNVLAGQYFALLQNGDRLSQTNIGWVTFKAGNKTARVREYITRSYVETDSVSSSKNSNQFADKVAKLKKDQEMFATCGVPDDSKNEVRIFSEVGVPKLSPVNTKLYRSQMHQLVVAASKS